MSETKITKMVVQKEGRKLIFNPAGDIDLSQYYTKSEIDSKFNSYALKTEIPDTSNLATKTELNSVKSTATTANSTANSAKTTAQTALNTANSKLTYADGKAYVQFNRGGAITATNNALIAVIAEDTYSNNKYYINGFSIFIFSINYVYNSENKIGTGYFSTLKKGSQLTTSNSYDSSRVGVYLY